MDIKKEALKLHRENRGKLEVRSKVKVESERDLTLAYSPGVAEPCREIEKDPEQIFTYTNRGNFVAVVTDGTAVLGLGDIGPEAALPVMEGKCVLFREFAGIDAFPLCLSTETPEEMVEAVRWFSPTFGGINLEDIKAPECFWIEERLKEELDIPVFHDDQHGTAIITLGALLNAAELVEKDLDQLRVVINGAGAAGVSLARILLAEGIEDIVLLDSAGALHPERGENMNPTKRDIAVRTNPRGQKGTLEEIIPGSDVFLGVSTGGVLTRKMVESMNRDPIILAMANPDPEIDPRDAYAAGARVVGTGRSDYPNQVNNVLAFPGIFRGALDVRARSINEEMKKAAAQALADLVSDGELADDYVIPKPFDPRVGPAVAGAVAGAAVATGVARIELTSKEVRSRAEDKMEGRTL